MHTSSFTTPSIPGWIMSLEHPSYRNIFSFRLGNRNLWGTETLLGDWYGKYLLVAKDFYPSKYIGDAVRSGVEQPYRHNPSAPTNRNLIKTLKHFGRLPVDHDNSSCGFLCVSACFLLRDDGKIRGPLPDGAAVLRLSSPVVQFTMDNMPNLTTVVLMGGDAEEAFCLGGGADQVKKCGLQKFTVRHPSYAMSDADRFSDWQPVFR
jgi:hypothetical protein